MSENLNVYQRIKAVMAALPYIQKKKLVPLGGRQVKTLAYEDLAAEVQPLLVAHGLVMESDLVKCSYEVQETGEKSDNYGTKKTYQTIASVEIRYRLVNVDNPTDATSWMTYPGMGYDTSDKAIGKATTYSAKDYLRKMLLVPSGEEPEDDNHERPAPVKAPAGPNADFPPKDGPIGRPAAPTPPKPAQAPPAVDPNDRLMVVLKSLSDKIGRQAAGAWLKQNCPAFDWKKGAPNYGLSDEGALAMLEQVRVLVEAKK